MFNTKGLPHLYVRSRAEPAGARTGVGLLQVENAPDHPVAVAGDDDENVVVASVEKKRLDAANLP
jgi:hypothetical protein